jgi:hypothetical protein
MAITLEESWAEAAMDRDIHNKRANSFSRMAIPCFESKWADYQHILSAIGFGTNFIC